MLKLENSALLSDGQDQFRIIIYINQRISGPVAHLSNFALHIQVGLRQRI